MYNKLKIMYKKGEKILYDNKEKGIVKTNQTDTSFVFVVFNCGGDWENFENYTAQNTPTNKISKGWSIYGTKEWCTENGGCDFIPYNSKWAGEGESICITCKRKN